MAEPDAQTVVHSGERGRIVTIDSAYYTRPENRDRDVVVNASYSGVLPAREVARNRPRAAIGVDCGIGKDGAGIAGLWYYEALDIPAAAADIDTVVLGDGLAMYERARISRVNTQARQCGVEPGMAVREAALLLLQNDPVKPEGTPTNRAVVHSAPSGRAIVCTDSIAFALPEDRDRNVLCTAGHTGRSSVPYLRKARPLGFICSDGGGGAERSGIAGLEIVEADRLAGAAVDARTARMGDGHSTYYDGVISACNCLARERGVEVGQTAIEAARLLLTGAP